ncbi:MAG TPA: response regulator transcription factor [Nocardioidaceae bacterium]|nr:response regulator transcription factor [Nocardioidaceae bacterium]
MSAGRVLVVDDEPGIVGFVSRALRADGLEVDAASNGETGLKMALGGHYDVVLLDLVMPGSDGVSVLQRLLRRKPEQAVLVLSCRTDTRSKVQCLDMGAVDYLGKPFALEELLARIHARMRGVPVQATTLTSHRFALDPVRQEVSQGTDAVLLTRRESTLLAELIRHAGAAVSKEQLLSSVWGFYFAPDTNVLDVYVRRLRSKLGADAIATVRGVGYGIDLD